MNNQVNNGGFLQYYFNTDEEYDDAYYELDEDTFLDRIERYVALHEEEIFAFPDAVMIQAIIKSQ